MMLSLKNAQGQLYPYLTSLPQYIFMVLYLIKHKVHLHDILG